MISQTRFRRTGVLVLLCVAVSLRFESSLAWVASKTSTHKDSSRATKSSQQPRKTRRYKISSGRGTITTAKFYKTSSSVLVEDAALAAAKAVMSESWTVSPFQRKKMLVESSSKASLYTIRNLPWLNEENADADTEETQNVFLSHWNWQFSFFEEHLTNLKVRVAEHPEDESIHDLYYAIKDSNGKSESKSKPKQRVYTVSLESDEYRDIRMTYMHCPAMQTFRCLSYPRNGDIPIMGMGLMRMGECRNLAILDYQPLPAVATATASATEGPSQLEINELYTSELLKLRDSMPSMSQPMTRRHFDSSEERKYFTEFPLLGRCNELEATAAETETYRSDLLEAQKKYVAKHTELTKNQRYSPTFENSSPEYVLERHSDFDTHVSEKEPAGPFLCGVFGPETGGKLVHNVIFPLSKHGLSGHTGN